MTEEIEQTAQDLGVILPLTMECLDGETLAEWIARDGPVPPREVLHYLAQMAHALDAAHRAGVIHRHFKPSNVMLVGAGGTNGSPVREAPGLWSLISVWRAESSLPPNRPTLRPRS